MLQTETDQALLAQEYQNLHDYQIYIAWCNQKEAEAAYKRLEEIEL